MKDFRELPASSIVYQGEHFFIARDGFPVSPGHLLVISNALKADFFELSDAEQLALPKMIHLARQKIEEEYTPDGYNIGMNCGEASGQTIFHFHCHVIPRFRGDTANPRGGVRHCIPGKGDYLK